MGGTLGLLLITNYQLEKDWIYKTTNVIERVNNIQDINKIYKQILFFCWINK